MNPGGLLNEAIKLCNIFIEKNTKIVETKVETLTGIKYIKQSLVHIIQKCP